MLIRAKNLLDVTSLSTGLSANAAIGATTYYVNNINSFYANWAVQLGRTNEEKAEILLLSGTVPSGTTLLTTTGGRFTHPIDTPVYAIKYDKIIFKRSTTGTAGTATVFTDSTVSITPDSLYTELDDTSALDTYAYKACFYNSVTGDVSADSDWITRSGYSPYTLIKIRERIKRKLISSNYIQQDEVIDDWINEWLEKMTNAAIDVNRDYLLGTEQIAFSAGQEMGTITSTDFKEVRKIQMVTANGTATVARMNITDFRADQVFTESLPQFYWQGDTVFGRKPIDNAGTATVFYYKRSPVMTDDTDEIPVSMQNYTKSFVDYGYAQACFLDQKDEKGYAFTNMANAELAQFKAEIAPRWKTGTQYVTIVSPLSSEDDFQLI